MLGLGSSERPSVLVSLGILLLASAVGNVFNFLSKSTPFSFSILGEAIIFVALLLGIAISVSAFVTNLCARLLGGRGDFVALYARLLVIYAFVLTGQAITEYLSSVVSSYFSAFSVLIGLAGIYLQVRAVQTTNGLSLLKAFIAWILPLIVIGVILFIVFGALLLAFFAR